MQAALTDAVIQDAVKRLPPEWYALGGEQLARDLIHRRDLLPEVAEKFYESLAHAGGRARHRPGRRRAPRRAGRTAWSWRSGRRPAAEPWFRRRFLEAETSEIRLYLLRRRRPPCHHRAPRRHHGPRVGRRGARPARRLGQRGNAVLRRGRRGRGREGRRHVGLARGVDAAAPQARHAVAGAARLRRASLNQYLLWWEPDPGIVLSASKLFLRYGFRKQPYAQLHRVGVEFKTARGAFRVYYDGDYRWARPALSTNVELWYDGAENYNFFGFGNETTVSERGRVDEFYEAHQRSSTPSPRSR